MTTIYRVENANHEGPYRMDPIEELMGYSPLHKQLEATLGVMGLDNLPTPYCDGIPVGWINPTDLSHHRQHGWRCGFVSLDSLHRWFNQCDMAALRKAGFHVALYESDRVCKGKHQCMFFLPQSKLLSTVAI